MVQHSSIDHTGLTGVGGSFASNVNRVDVANYGGAASTVTRGDHVHLGVTSLSHTSNTYSGPVTLVAEGTIGITTPSTGTFAVNAVAGGGGAAAASAAVGRMHHVYPPGYSPAGTALSAANLGINGGTFAQSIVIPATFYLDSFRYRNFDTATARSIEFALYLDDGDATSAQIAYGTDSFTPSAASNRVAAFTGAPITVDPGVYWFVVRNTGGATNFQFSLQVATASGMGDVQIQIKTLASALADPEDLSTGWTRTSLNSMAFALLGRVFGEGSAF